ncbi:hypothetical protein D1012_06760 [Pseudotabrizicola alkalilacus]|uniref:Uncharacterized protein n=1 Tax=Pseudotabrizicola alkalilacus TaxID=2305252 RepID=A0A411Z3H9_9RHOB|nr:hypothetical protein D1012_06760 [Pseudotabrizicola alkalilacus]
MPLTMPRQHLMEYFRVFLGVYPQNRNHQHRMLRRHLHGSRLVIRMSVRLSHQSRNSEQTVEHDWH